jgi:hypothetical protein
MSPESFLFAAVGLALAVAGLALTYYYWRASGVRPSTAIALVGPSGAEYVPKLGTVPLCEVTVSNRGRSAISVVDVKLLTPVGWAMAAGGPPVAADLAEVVVCRGCADGPPLPTDLTPGSSLKWVFPKRMIDHDALRPILLAQAEFGTGQISQVTKALEWGPRGVVLVVDP